MHKVIEMSHDITELETKNYWLRKFRRAKTHETLSHMFERAEQRYSNSNKIIASIYLAECQRNREIESGTILKK